MYNMGIKQTNMGIYQMDSNGIFIMNDLSHCQATNRNSGQRSFPMFSPWHDAHCSFGALGTQQRKRCLNFWHLAACQPGNAREARLCKTSLWVSKPRKLQEHVSKKLSFPSVSYRFIATPKKITTSSIVRCIYQCNGREL
jgi:hypothetical protein